MTLFFVMILPFVHFTFCECRRVLLGFQPAAELKLHRFKVHFFQSKDRKAGLADRRRKGFLAHSLVIAINSPETETAAPLTDTALLKDPPVDDLLLAKRRADFGIAVLEELDLVVHPVGVAQLQCEAVDGRAEIPQAPVEAKVRTSGV